MATGSRDFDILHQKVENGNRFMGLSQKLKMATGLWDLAKKLKMATGSWKLEKFNQNLDLVKFS